MKKKLLILSTALTVIAPIAAIVSCGSDKDIDPNKNSDPGTTGNPGNGADKSVPFTLINKNNVIYTGKPTTPTDTGNTGNAVIGKPQLPTTDTGNTQVGKPQVPQTTSTDWVIQTPATEIIQPVIPAVDAEDIPSTTADLIKFKISTITEDPKVFGSLSGLTNTPREFRQYDNGLFKIKIETSLIGTNKYYASEAKADLAAEAIVKNINIGPAITHLSKGIQILKSDSPNSLGGPFGVQVARTNNDGSSDDEGTNSIASLVAHEYGHHETMWDFLHLMGGFIGENPATNQENLRAAMARGLDAAGYKTIAEQVRKVDPSKVGTYDSEAGKPSDMPTSYGTVESATHWVSNTPDYLFSAPEIATRALNILSTRTALDPIDLYTAGKAGEYTSGTFFEPPAAFMSDASIRKYAKDSIFGEGKDNSRTKALEDFYLKDIFGEGKGSINLTCPQGSNKITRLEMTSFDMLPNLDKIQIYSSSGESTTYPVTTFNSRIGFKDELVTDSWSRIETKQVKQIDIKLNIDLNDGKTYSVYGLDANDKNVDISKLFVDKMKATEISTYDNKRGLSPYDDYFNIG